MDKKNIELLEQFPHLANFMTPDFKQDWLEGRYDNEPALDFSLTKLCRNYSDNDSLPPDEIILDAKKRANSILDPNGEDTY